MPDKMFIYLAMYWDRFFSGSKMTDPVPCSALWNLTLTAIYAPFKGCFTYRQSSSFAP